MRVACGRERGGCLRQRRGVAVNMTAGAPNLGSVGRLETAGWSPWGWSGGLKPTRLKTPSPFFIKKQPSKIPCLAIYDRYSANFGPWGQGPLRHKKEALVCFVTPGGLGEMVPVTGFHNAIPSKEKSPKISTHLMLVLSKKKIRKLHQASFVFVLLNFSLFGVPERTPGHQPTIFEQKTLPFLVQAGAP